MNTKRYRIDRFENGSEWGIWDRFYDMWAVYPIFKTRRDAKESARWNEINLSEKLPKGHIYNP
jgi:hypothetical protein